MFASLSEFDDWFAVRCAAHRYRVRRAPLDRTEGWYAEAGTGNLVHRSGRFFSVEGLEVRTSGREIESWSQPIIVQAEHGILGILVKEFGGVPHFLLQAKMEPGNVNLIQMSPTVQATRSNYSRVHGGRSVPYLDRFVAPHGGRVRHDALQSEQASWFLAKRNRNMVVETTDDVPLEDDFCWLSVHQVGALLARDNIINMDTRTVLSGAIGLGGAPTASLSGTPDEDTFRDTLARSWQPGARSWRTTEELLSWFTEAKCRCTLQRARIPLDSVTGWSTRDGEIVHEDGAHFTVVGVDVEASNREVTRWSQVMFAPRSTGVIAFLTRRIGGVMHLLVQARVETGGHDLVEMAPTVQCQPDSYRSCPARRPRFLDEVLGAGADRVRFSALHSEEGGRFLHAQNRYLLVEAPDDLSTEVSENFAWMTLRQLTDFVRFGNLINVEARSLLTFLGFTDLGSAVLQDV